ncbi:OmpA family protein [Actinomycetospora aeridis]|uniref:OmpA family protein n=1 Tax=Actinomycetospora aeridis TaxID=3129231 RepID=A0ABU8NDE4_9PSEU
MTGGGHHRGRVTGAPGGAHWWGGRGPAGGGTHAAPGDRRRRLPVLLALVVLLLAGGAVAFALTRPPDPAPTPTAAEQPGTQPGPQPGAVPAGGTRPPSRTGPDAAVLQSTIDEILAAAPLRFPADSATPGADASAAVSRVAAVLRATPGPPVTVEGHTAPAGEDTGDAQALSQRRAEEVVRLLEDAGVPAGSLTAVGVGPADPLGSLEASRRVEIRVG